MITESIQQLNITVLTSSNVRHCAVCQQCH